MDVSGEVHDPVNEIEVTEKLIVRARQGDDQAWEVIVRRHEEAVFRLAYLILGDVDEAADAAQEAFVRAFLSLEQFDTGRPLRPWLLGIGINLARNRRRAAGRYLAHLRRLLVRTAEPVPDAEQLSRRVQQRWEADMLWQAVQQLNQIGQDVIYLRYFLDMPEATMAETLAVAPGTVKSRLHRATRRLRMIIEKDFPSLREAFES